MRRAQFHNPRLHRLSAAAWARQRTARPVLKAHVATLAMPPQILVTRLPADTETPTQLGHRHITLLGQSNKLTTTLHDRNRLPGHRSAPRRPSPKVSTMSPNIRQVCLRSVQAYGPSGSRAEPWPSLL